MNYWYQKSYLPPALDVPVHNLFIIHGTEQ